MEHCHESQLAWWPTGHTQFIHQITSLTVVAQVALRLKIFLIMLKAS